MTQLELFGNAPEKKPEKPVVSNSMKRRLAIQAGVPAEDIGKVVSGEIPLASLPQFNVGDAVIDNDGYPGEVVEYDGEPLPTKFHVHVRVGKNHPQYYTKRPILYAADRLTKI